MSDKEFIELMFELAYGDNAINEGRSKDSVASRIAYYSDASRLAEELSDSLIEMQRGKLI